MGLETLFIAGSIASLTGGLIGAAAQHTSLKYQQATADYNAKMAEMSANAEADRQARVDARNLASAQGTMASSGLLVNSGSSLAVLSDMAAQQAENRLQIRYKGQVGAADARNRATAYGQRATGALVSGVSRFGSGVASTSYTYNRMIS